ncbi:hypothetical protein BJF83_17750 [Nocardiopsis sp. CNR-923]|uniref:hypothetical protein n=1 Tax=Nocardiopsis sp. CNR-923 TaxID=1904965 RepID=UPI00095A2B0A|nr:hypothetical protein [Nocardiopsis sp. CNR-923]OLT27701.1 hypothetical protein BJF83_17750 [Nocardiopsis sp. CNR-923]
MCPRQKEPYRRGSRLVPPDSPLTPGERRQQDAQTRALKFRREWEEFLRARGERVPGPFEGVEWGD